MLAARRVRTESGAFLLMYCQGEAPHKESFVGTRELRVHLVWKRTSEAGMA